MRCKVRALLLVLVAIALVGAVQMSGCSKASQPFQSGKLYFSQKLYQKAAEQFQLAAEEDPENGKNYLELAKCYAELDENEKAGQNFTLALEKDPTLKKDVDDAIQHYRAAHYNHAVELMKEKSYGDAISELQEAAYLDPRDPNQYINMGVCYSELKQPDLAVKFYEKALALSPEDKMARENLIATFANQAGEFRRQKSHDEAIKFYTKVLELTSGVDSLDVENTPPADLVAMFKETEKGTGYLFDLGISYLDKAEDKGDKKALALASGIFKALYDDNPADDDALYYYAYSRSVAEDYSDAIMAFGKLLDRNPREATYYMDMASAYVKAAGSNSEMQMKGVLYFALARALESDDNKLAKSTFKDTATLEKRLKDKYKAWADMKKAIGSMGLPEDIYAYTEDSGNQVEAWMYWSKGEAAVFTNGYETGKISFAPQE